MAAMFCAVMPAVFKALRAMAIWDDQISFASCSTQPGLGKIWRNSFWATAMIEPRLSKTMARELVVPWSRARMYFFMKSQ